MGLHHLHERGIVHGDLKGVCLYQPHCPVLSTNLQHSILISNQMPSRACLADFGLSTLAPGTLGQISMTTNGGTPSYMAPELFDPTKFGKTGSRPTRPADIYAFGMVIYEVLTGSDPFYDKKFGQYQLVLHVLAGKRPTKPGNARKIGFESGTWELVVKCWNEKSTGRPAIGQVLAHFPHSLYPTTTKTSSILCPQLPNLPSQIQKPSSRSGGTLLLRILKP